MAVKYTVNGQEMSEEEFYRFQEENGFYNFDNYNHQRRRWDHKPHLFQCYKNTAPNLWNEISIDEFNYDIGKKPKFLKSLCYVQMSNKDYYIISSPVVAIFYNHVNDEFLYMREGGLIDESNCFKDYDTALNAIKELENKKYGEHKLFSATGDFIMDVQINVS